MKITSYLNDTPVTYDIEIDAEIGAPSQSTFIYTPPYGPVPTTIQFTSTNDVIGESIVGWIWDFDNTNPGIYTSTLEAPTHTYTVAGVYQVAFIAVNVLNQLAPAYTDIAISANASTFTAAPTTPSGLEYTFTNTTTLPSPDPGFLYDYAWYFGDGNSNFSNDPDVIYEYAAPGTYTVTQAIILYEENDPGNSTVVYSQNQQINAGASGTSRVIAGGVNMRSVRI